jgi:hypothetical protein
MLFWKTRRTSMNLVLAALAGLIPSGAQEVQAQLDAIKGVLPKFAIPMREVGDRFQDMYFAAKGGNWGLAAYMSKYMDGAMKPASLTKVEEYAAWRSYYDETFVPVNKAVAAQNFKAFSVAYDNAIQACNACHEGMGYKFIVITKQKAPSNQGMNYRVPSKATDVPR